MFRNTGIAVDVWLKFSRLHQAETSGLRCNGELHNNYLSFCKVDVWCHWQEILSCSDTNGELLIWVFQDADVTFRMATHGFKIYLVKDNGELLYL